MEAFAVAIQSVINDSGFLAFTTGKPTRIIIALPVVNARNPLSVITD